MPIIKIAIRSPDSENKIHLSIEVNKVFFFCRKIAQGEQCWENVAHSVGSDDTEKSARMTS